MTVGNVVGQFEFVKRDAWFCHPGLASCRWIRVNVHSFCQFGIGFTSDHPFCIVIFVTSGHTEHADLFQIIYSSTMSFWKAQLVTSIKIEQSLLTSKNVSVSFLVIGSIISTVKGKAVGNITKPDLPVTVSYGKVTVRLYLTSSAAAISINMQYLAFGLSPLTWVL